MSKRIQTPITKLKVQCIVPSLTPQLVSFNLFLSSLQFFLHSCIHVHTYVIPKLVITWVVQVAPFLSPFNSQSASGYSSSSVDIIRFTSFLHFLSQEDYFYELNTFPVPKH